MADYIQGQEGENQQMEEKVKPAYVISQLNHAVILSYNGLSLMVPPQGKVLVANQDLLGSALPRGIFVVSAPK